MNAVEIFLFVLAGLTVFYTSFLTRIHLGLMRISAHPSAGMMPRVTVIVAARDEETNILPCMQSILAQDYPHNLLEIIVVDDESTDGTADVLRTLVARESRVRVFQVPPRPKGIIGRKPEAVALGVTQATGEIVVTTDADCRHASTWLSTMISYFDPSTALVAGPVVIAPGNSLFDSVERLDFLGLVTAGAGLIGAGRPIICNGANLAYRLSAYRTVQNRVQVSSNDDGTLMSRIVTQRVGSVRFAASPRAVVRTHPTGSIGNFFRQRTRWAAVRGRFLDWTIYAELVLLFLFFLALLAGFVLVIPQPLLLIPLGIVLAGKALIDLFALRHGARICGMDVPITSFLLAELFHAPSIVAATFLSVTAQFHWKGRHLSR
ncbi:MAG: hypothetical protein A2X67_09340 [Ignavibacteria bacterium GWA2_55_11]|nr:MAG: hypothetical protein A2X67_09340 [Ignavibacteria bacterium GWA2_55_11]